VVCVLVLPFLCAATPNVATSPEMPATCAGIPDGELLIDGLATGQVLHGDDGTTTLRFANGVYGCGEWPNSTSSADGCETKWTFRLRLPLPALQVGVYDLADVGADFGYLMNAPTSTPHGGGCSDQWCSSAQDGVGIEAMNAGSVLEIYSADPNCFTGKLSGFVPAGPAPYPDANGAFFATPCAN